MADADRPDRHVLQFQTTAKAAADANALSGLGFARFDLIVDILAMILAVLVAATGNLDVVDGSDDLHLRHVPVLEDHRTEVARQ